jgi:histidyl-tRNA synthetase
MRSYGYINVQVPAIEEADIFLSKAGDQVIDSLFTFERFGKALALRPEFTALAAYRYAEQYPDGDQICRWQFNGSVFNDKYDDRSQSYQRMSMGAEILGMPPPIADAEVIGMAAIGLTEVSDISDMRIHMGHIGLIRALLRQFNLDPRNEQFIFQHLGVLMRQVMSKDEILHRVYDIMGESGVESSQASTEITDSSTSTQHMLDVMLDATQSGNTMGGRSRAEIVSRLLKKQQRRSQWHQVTDALDLLDEIVRIKGNYSYVFDALSQFTRHNKNGADRLLDEWRQIIDLTVESGVPEPSIHINPGLTRGWNYYSGLTFEFTDQANQHIYGGGGRYDELVEILGARTSVPALGFAYYMDNIVKHTSSQKSEHESKNIYLINSSNQHHMAFAWANLLRQRNYSVAIMPYQPHIKTDFYLQLHVEDANVRLRNNVYSMEEIVRLEQAIEDILRNHE